MQWVRLKALFHGNRSESISTVLDAIMVSRLSLEIGKTGEGLDGIEPDDVVEMAQLLTSVTRVILCTKEQVRLIDPVPGPEPKYFEALLGFSDRITHLASINITPDDLGCHRELAEFPPRLTHFLGDNLSQMTFTSTRKPPTGVRRLESLRLRNVEEHFPIVGFRQLLGSGCLHTLQLKNTTLNDMEFTPLLSLMSGSLRRLEIGTPATPDAFERKHGLLRHLGANNQSLPPERYLNLADIRYRSQRGDQAAAKASHASELSVGGLFCVSRNIFPILLNRERPLNTLRFFNAGPLRPSRPEDHPEAAEERALLLDHPSGIEPGDVLAAFEQGLRVSRLEMIDMGKEWDLETSKAARRVADECRRWGIVFVCR